jgi:N-acyl amino acid synthase of PEP-CTERM/exosortase system
MSRKSTAAPMGRKTRADRQNSSKGPKKERLSTVYARYFDCVPAETEEQRAEAFRLRYQVYCKEHDFEDPSDSPDGFEQDQLDAHALHTLLMHRPSETFVGTVRLILPGVEENGLEFPIRTVCDKNLLSENNENLPQEYTAEISRFAVSKNFRRRDGDEQTTVGGYNDDEDPRRLIPHISLGLMQAIVEMARRGGVTHLCAMMEPALLRMLSRLGIHFNNLGPRVEYHGTRQPCYSDLDLLLTRTWIERREVWEILTRDGEIWPLNVELAESLREEELAAAE